MGVLGDILFRAASVWDNLAGNITTTKKFLTQTGTGAVSAAPGWNTIVNGDLPDTAVTPGTYGDATHVGQFTVNQKGVLTAASSVAITFPTATDYVLMSDGSTPPNAMNNGGSSFLYIGYTP